MQESIARRLPVPNACQPAEKSPGHWVLARLGKKVLRPGGLAMTREMIRALRIGTGDRVVEFAPGLGVTARLTLESNPLSYTAVEQDPDAAARVSELLNGVNQQCIVGSAQHSGLPDGKASVVYGEAMLSMQPYTRKIEIMDEANRLLEDEGRYAIHELALVNVTPELQQQIYKELAEALHVGASPLTKDQWTQALENAGFRVTDVFSAPMALLEPRRMINDEGLLSCFRILYRLLKDKESGARFFKMRKVFRKYRAHLSAIVIIAHKKYLPAGPADKPRR